MRIHSINFTKFNVFFFYFMLIDLCKMCILCPRIILGTFFHFILFRNWIIKNFLNICLLVQCFCRACRVQRRSGEKTLHIETIITKGIKFSPLQAGSRIGLICILTRHSLRNVKKNCACARRVRKLLQWDLLSLSLSLSL